MGELARAKDKVNKKRILKEQAATKGLSEKDFMKELLEGMTPMPRFVQAHLKTIADGSGIRPDLLLAYHTIHSMAIINAGVLLCGKPILNPFIDFEEGFIANWGELYTWLRQEYERFFIASQLLEEKTEK